VSAGPEPGTPLVAATAQELPVSPVEAKNVWPWAAAWARATSSITIDPSRKASRSHSPSDADPAWATSWAAEGIDRADRSESVREVAS